MKQYQKGYLNIPGGVFETLFFFSVIGALAALCAFGYGIYWLITHMRFV
jgi:hypothetical protein